MTSATLGTGLTPSSNTGLNSQRLCTESQSWDLRVKVDWFQGTMKPFPATRLEAVIEAYERLTGDKFVLEPGKGSYMGKQWANQGRSAAGARIWWNRPTENGDRQGHCLFSLPGSALSNLAAGTVRELVSILVTQFGLKPTRIDVAIDDYTKRIGFAEVVDAVESYNYAKFRDYDIRKNGGRNRKGFTVYCGMPSSNRRLRFYDKHAESKGEIDAYRWEAQLKDEVAVAAIADWLMISEEISAQYLAGLVVGSVEFVDRSGEKNVNRMKELPWWKEFKDAVACSIRHSIQRVMTTLKKAENWVDGQVVCTLAAIKYVVGETKFVRWIEGLIEKAPERFTEKTMAKIALWEREFATG